MRVDDWLIQKSVLHEKNDRYKMHQRNQKKMQENIYNDLLRRETTWGELIGSKLIVTI